MEITVDTSVLIAVIANEPTKPALVNITRGLDLIAPLSVHWEIGNAFAAMFKRKIVTLPYALKALDFYQEIPVRFTDVELVESLRLAAELNLYAYDAYLLRCAIKYKAPLLSLDEKLVRVAREKNIETVEFTK